MQIRIYTHARSVHLYEDPSEVKNQEGSASGGSLHRRHSRGLAYA